MPSAPKLPHPGWRPAFGRWLSTGADGFVWSRLDGHGTRGPDGTSQL